MYLFCVFLNALEAACNEATTEAIALVASRFSTADPTALWSLMESMSL